MPNLRRPLMPHPLAALALGGAIVCGLIEWVALWRCRRREQRADPPRARHAEKA